jgi:glycine oxidase
VEKKLNKNKADVAIIGGGIIGCSIAYELAKRQLDVILIEKASRVGTEASWAGAGILTSHASTHEPYPELCRASLAMYPTLAEELKSETDIDIEFIRSGTLSVFFDEAEASGLIGLAERRVNRGFSAEVLSPEQAWQLEPAVSKAIAGAVLFPEDGHVRNPKMVTALAKGAAKFGAKFLVGNPVTGFIRKNEQVVGAVVNGETIHADSFVIAAGCWAGNLTALLDFHISISPAKGQIVLLETMPPIFQRTIDGLGIYIVPRADGKILLGATVEFVGFDKTPSVDGVKQMIDAAVGIAPELAQSAFVQTWVGLRPYFKSGPCLGYLPGYDNVVLASGHYKNGILLAPITGKLIAELITTGQPSLSLNPFTPVCE